MIAFELESQEELIENFGDYSWFRRKEENAMQSSQENRKLLNHVYYFNSFLTTLHTFSIVKNN